MKRRHQPKRKCGQNTKSGPVKEMDQQKNKFIPRPFLKTEPIIVVEPIKTEPGTLVKRGDEEDYDSDNYDNSTLLSDGELFSVVQLAGVTKPDRSGDPRGPSTLGDPRGPWGTCETNIVIIG